MEKSEKDETVFVPAGFNVLPRAFLAKDRKAQKNVKFYYASRKDSTPSSLQAAAPRKLYPRSGSSPANQLSKEDRC